jgi:hypothetical protein
MSSRCQQLREEAKIETSLLIFKSKMSEGMVLVPRFPTSSKSTFSARTSAIRDSISSSWNSALSWICCATSCI